MKYQETKDIFKDPVCGMAVGQLTAPAEYQYNGRTYYFCAEVCRDKFIANPENYISKWPRHEEKSSSL